MALVHISFILFIVYTSAMIVAFGIPASISDTYYLLERKRRGLGWLFTAFCWGVSLTLLPAWLDMTPEAYQAVPFLAAAGLMFVGAAPQFKLPLTGPVHYVSAAVCCASAIFWCILSGYWFIPFNAFLIYGWVALRYGKPMFWIEMAAFTSMYVCVFIR